MIRVSSIEIFRGLSTILTRPAGHHRCSSGQLNLVVSVAVKFAVFVAGVFQLVDDRMQ